LSTDTCQKLPGDVSLDKKKEGIMVDKEKDTAGNCEEVVITDAHPDYTPKQTLRIKLEGGSPYFGYVWMDGEIYTIIKRARSYQVKKVKGWK